MVFEKLCLQVILETGNEKRRQLPPCMYYVFEAIGIELDSMPRTGIEPVRVFTPQDFKSCASTDFATWAEMVSRMGLEPMAP